MSNSRRKTLSSLKKDEISFAQKNHFGSLRVEAKDSDSPRKFYEELLLCSMVFLFFLETIGCKSLSRSNRFRCPQRDLESSYCCSLVCLFVLETLGYEASEFAIAS